ncbi:nuclear transport factor 2 family protein [Holzapfeliella sp. He02]|uniref:Nuclear transport factor 2 family protein n=1 Tax=Holzapfeliella saturejae TaxID=3082953 RepID=A0ABU8SGP8_9LACO
MSSLSNQEIAVRQVYQRLYQDMINRDTSDLSSLLIDDFYLVHITGVQQSKNDWLGAIENSSMQYFSAEEDQLTFENLTASKPTIVAKNRVDADISGMRRIWNLQLTISFETVNN